MDQKQLIKFDLLQLLIEWEKQGYYVVSLQLGENTETEIKVEIKVGKLECNQKP